MHLLLSVLIALVAISIIPTVFSDSIRGEFTIPNWIKNTAGWWATDVISETEFVNAIEFLIKENIIQVNVSQTSETSQSVPDWVKNTAGWWAEGQIDDSSFLSGLEWLVSNAIIKISEECVFDGAEYSHLFDEERQLLCDGFNFNFVTQSTVSSDGGDTKYNSEGFRGPEFLKNKPDNTYRIFAIGGSTTFGMKNDAETWPHYLQEIFDTLDLTYNVEIINAGISSGWSGSETKLIRDRILDYDPDMLLIYDGWNDVRMQLGEPQGRIAKPEMTNPTLWKERWIESCELTNANNVKTIVTLQPFLGTGERILSNQEMALFRSYAYWIQNDVQEYTKYQKQLEEISKYCTETKDLAGIYAQIDKPIYLDLGHVGLEGDKIVATHFFKLAHPYIPGNEAIDPSKTVNSFLHESTTKSQSIPPELDLRGKSFVNTVFTNQDLSESIFYVTRFQNAYFMNADLENTDFKFTLIVGTNFSGANLKNAELSRTQIHSSDFTSADLTSVNLSTAKITDAKFTNAILSNSKFLGTDLRYIDLDGANLENSVFDNSVMVSTDMKNTKSIKNMEMRFASFYDVDFNGVDFSEIIFGPQNAFARSDFRNSSLPTLQLVDTDFSAKEEVQPDGRVLFFKGSNLSNLDFSNTDMSRSIFSHQTPDLYLTADLQELQSGIDSRSQHRGDLSVDLSEATLTGANLSGKNLTLLIFYGANLSNADLSGADLRYADLRYANLSGSDLTNANLEFADLDGAYSDDNTILKCINHHICLDG